MIKINKVWVLVFDCYCFKLNTRIAILWLCKQMFHEFPSSECSTLNNFSVAVKIDLIVTIWSTVILFVNFCKFVQNHGPIINKSLKYNVHTDCLLPCRSESRVVCPSALFSYVCLLTTYFPFLLCKRHSDWLGSSQYRAVLGDLVVVNMRFQYKAHDLYLHHSWSVVVNFFCPLSALENNAPLCRPKIFLAPPCPCKRKFCHSPGVKPHPFPAII